MIKLNILYTGSKSWISFEITCWKIQIVLYGYSFTVQIKTNGIYKDVGEDVETKFNTSNYELDRPLPKGKNKNGIGSIKDKLN